jgi:hypothetical protein
LAYRIRYQIFIDWLPPGIGPMGGYPTAAGGNIGPAPASGTVTLALFDNPPPVVAGGGTGNALVTGDVTTLTNAMAADIAAQMNVPATLARLAAFATGGT